MEKQRTITANDLVIRDKEIYDAVMAAVEYADTRPKLGVLKSHLIKNTSNMEEKKCNMEPTEEYAGLGKEAFIYKREDFGNPSLWHKVSLADDSKVSISSDSATGQQTSKKKPRSFTGTFILVDDKIARYEAQMLAVTVLPVFSKSMLPVTLPHTPFQLRDGYTTLYRNRHNFFYAAMRNIFSQSFSEKSEEEQLFERLETAQEFGNYEV